jgi:hypothetical protein
VVIVDSLIKDKEYRSQKDYMNYVSSRFNHKRQSSVEIQRNVKSDLEHHAGSRNDKSLQNLQMVSGETNVTQDSIEDLTN